MILITTQTALADNRQDHDRRDPRQDDRICMDRLDSAREIIADLKRENNNFRRENEDLRNEIDRLKGETRAKIGTITKGHYLIGSNCGKIQDSAYLSEGTTVKVIGSNVNFGSYGKGAIRVRVIENSIKDSISAESGCEGYALNFYIMR
jgi:hypothetical protein